MEIQEIKVRDRLKIRGLKNKGLIEILEDSKGGGLVLIIAKGIHKKWLIFNFPEGMWKVRCSKDEVLDVVKNMLAEKILVA